MTDIKYTSMKHEGYIDWFISQQINKHGIQGTLKRYKIMREELTNITHTTSDKNSASIVSDVISIIEIIIEEIKRK